MLHLKTFGGLSVEAGGVTTGRAAQQRKTLALLALLAAAGRRGISRDKLIAYLWPNADTERGRNLLNQACYALRRDLHSPDLFGGSPELRLNSDVITTDVERFEEALESNDLAGAVAIYAGPFLDGFYLTGGGEFERWVEDERARLVKRASDALESLAARADAAGDLRGSVKWWRRLTELDRLSSTAALGLIKTLVAAGDRAAALEFGRVHAKIVEQVLGTAPDPVITELLERLPVVGRQPASPPPPPVTPPVPAAPPPLRRPAARFGKRVVLGAAALLLAGSIVFVAGFWKLPLLDPDLLAVAPFEILDPKLELWREGLADVLSRNLDGALQLRTVPPTVTVRRWEGRADRTSARRLGRRTGAGLVLFGELSRAGPDSVRLRGAVFDAGKDGIVAEIERTAQADRIDRMADSLSLDVMRALTPSTSWVYARLASAGTRSLPALKAFLQGETYFRRFALDSAVANYDRAIALDSSLALAILRAGQARAWNLQPGGDMAARAGRLNHGLSPRDSLMVAASAVTPAVNNPSFYQLVRRKEILLGDAIGRYPEDPEVWLEVGEVQYHLGFAWADSTWNRARRSFNHVIALDSGFTLAYMHPVELALVDNDPEAARRYVRGYLAIPSVAVDGAGMRLLGLLLDRPHFRPNDFAREVDRASVVTLRRLALAIRSWPDTDETQIAVARRLLERMREGQSSARADTEYALRPYRSLLARALIHRGHLREARRVVGKRFVMPAFLELAELGAIASEAVDSALAEWFAGSSSQGDHLIFPWLMDGPCYRTLGAALWWASQRNTAKLQRLVEREDSTAYVINPADVAPHARPVPAFARAALALARGDTAVALRRFLAFPDSSCPGSRQRREVQFRLLAGAGRDRDAAWVFDRLYDRRVPLILLRARLAERMGDRNVAIHYYKFVLQAWLHADLELQPVVAEARTALARLGWEGR